MSYSSSSISAQGSRTPLAGRTTLDLQRRDFSIDDRRARISMEYARESVDATRAVSLDVEASRRQLHGAKCNTQCAPRDAEPSIEGWLLKEGRGMLVTRWQKRYFALYGTRLLYWVEESDFRSNMPFKGEIELEGCSLVVGEHGKKDRPNSFGVFHPQRRDYFLEAPAKKDLHRWVKRMEMALGLRSEGISLQDFDLLSVVGKGAAGMVYAVKKKDSGQVYAMKVISKASMREKQGLVSHQQYQSETQDRQHLAGTHMEKAMYKRWMVQSVKVERKILENVNHPFIVRLFFAFQTIDKLCFVMDFVNGGELYTHIAREKKFTEDRARFYTGEVILALEYLHEMGVIYRDLKPENILLDCEGHLKLTDFGQSKHHKKESEGKEGRSTSMVGSPYYMAPEIFLKKGHGIPADWWSLGVLIYEMLVGLPPFYSENTSKAYKQLLTDEIEYPSYISEEAKKLLKGLLNTEADARFGGTDPPGKWERGEVQRINRKWNFAWLASIDWARLLAKQIKPPLKPKVSGPADVSQISSQFTSEEIKLETEAVWNAAARQDIEFEGFAYEGEPSANSPRRAQAPQMRVGASAGGMDGRFDPYDMAGVPENDKMRFKYGAPAPHDSKTVQLDPPPIHRGSSVGAMFDKLRGKKKPSMNDLTTFVESPGVSPTKHSPPPASQGFHVAGDFFPHSGTLPTVKSQEHLGGDS